MWNWFIYVICGFVCIKTASYGIWCVRNTGIAGGIAVFVIAVLSLMPLVTLR